MKVNSKYTKIQNWTLNLGYYENICKKNIFAPKFYIGVLTTPDIMHKKLNEWMIYISAKSTHIITNSIGLKII